MRDILLTAIAPITWATTYIVTTEFLPANRPFTTAALRALPIGLILLAIFRKLPEGVWIKRSIILGALNFGFFFALLFIGIYRLPGGVASVIGAIQPLIVVFLAYFLLEEKLTIFKIAAAILGIFGVSLIVLRPSAQLDAVGIVAVLAATVLMGTATVTLKKWGKPPVPLLIFTSWQLVVGGLMLTVLTLLTEGLPPALTATNAAGYAYIGIISTGLAYALWFRGIGPLTATTVTFIALVNPVVAILIDAVFLGKNLNVLQIFGAALVLLSIILAQKSTRQNIYQIV